MNPQHFQAFLEITPDFQHGCSSLIGKDCTRATDTYHVYCPLGGAVWSIDGTELHVGARAVVPRLDSSE